MATTISRETEQDIHFPRAGIDLSMPVYKQPARQLPTGEYVRTCPVGNNVRSYEATTQRSRGGSRCGLAKQWPDTVSGGTFLVQEMILIAGSGFTPPGGTMQNSNSGRVVLLVAVSAGRIFTAAPAELVWTESLYMTPGIPLNFTGVLFSAPNNQKLWFADGAHWCYYDSTVNTTFPWVASAGTLPVDSAGNLPRLICTWRGRTVLSGLLKDPQNWFMSAIGDPTNFDYAPLSPGPNDAIAGNNAPLGLIGDVITSMCPYTDDILIFFGNNTIWMMRGDPADGGRVDLISDVIGGAWGICWCKDDVGNVYFFSNKCGIFSLVPGQAPIRISQAIEQLLIAVNTGENAIRMVYDARFQGIHIFVTNIASPQPAQHFFYEIRTGGWFTSSFTDQNMNPLCCAVLDGNDPDDRVVVIGSFDGYVRGVTADATDDDGVPIESEVLIGPFVTATLDDITLYSLQSQLGADSGSITMSLLLGETAEEALRATPVELTTWKAGRNLTNHLRRSAHAIYIRLTASNPWAMESLRARIGTRGKVRSRGH